MDVEKLHEQGLTAIFKTTLAQEEVADLINNLNLAKQDLAVVTARRELELISKAENGIGKNAEERNRAITLFLDECQDYHKANRLVLDLEHSLTIAKAKVSEQEQLAKLARVTLHSLGTSNDQ